MRTVPSAVLPPTSSSWPGEPDSLEQLIGDCRRLAARWQTAAAPARAVAAPAGPHGVTVPAATAHFVAGMSEYGG
ncbi:hypothetical protein [Actinacidiphila sp. ITFR-21]|uniref:hypothetical protein n=1 Tax=Actinacidiphila sp. ITFR-21 TaxID=3075199 RepID=UPI002889B6D6|nr:hypothetical protein [Streptomyces sp. ITFR-21]WNI15189.1 hypothetical protein RLT57_06330 [Streptomyces sp. ITFR-21]